MRVRTGTSASTRKGSVSIKVIRADGKEFDIGQLTGGKGLRGWWARFMARRRLKRWNKDVARRTAQG